MCSPKVLATIIGSIYTLFVYFLFSNLLGYADNTSAFILPVLALAYFCNVEKENWSLFFILFLVLYSISDLMILISDKLPFYYDYFIGNALYILAYISLSIEIGRNISFTYILKNYIFSVIVLFILNCYIGYKISQIINPYLEFGSEYLTEIMYNVSMLMVLSLALLNYFCNDSKKALYVLIGAICILFSEVLSVAYLYVSHQSVLNFFTITLKLIGVYFFYGQAKLKYAKQEKAIY